jgi:RAB protein geranylgeranyltransferase component A
MEEDHKYTLIYKGTRIEDCISLRVNIGSKVLVVDTKDNYGTTYEGIETSEYTKKLKILKQSGERFLYESIPRVVRLSDGIFRVVNEMNIVPFLNFIRINDHFYIKEDGTVFKVPNCKAEIANAEFLNYKEKRILVKFIEGKIGLDEVLEEVRKESLDVMVRGVCGKKKIEDQIFKRYCVNFGNPPFVYPVNGWKDISEAMSRCHALNGVSYLIDKDIEIERKERGCIIKSVYGEISGDVYVEPKMKEGDVKYYRVVHISSKFHSGRFYGTFDGEEIINCLCLDSSTETCEENRWIVYLWKHENEISDEDIARIGLRGEVILDDFQFEVHVEFDWDHLISVKQAMKRQA